MSVNTLQVQFCQINPKVGDIEANTQQIIKAISQGDGCDLLIFPELSIIGYPPEDLLLRPSLNVRVEKALKDIQEVVDSEQWVVLGYPKSDQNDSGYGNAQSNGKLYNTAGVIHDHKIIQEYYKKELPNYSVFDEKRYFKAGKDSATFNIKGLCFGLSICEDIWFEDVAKKTAEAGAKVLININASPFSMGKHQQRIDIAKGRACDNQLAVLYAHMVGGQDELVFDGASFAMNAKGQVCHQAPRFETASSQFQLSQGSNGLVEINSTDGPPEQKWVEHLEQSVYQALVLAVRDYIDKNGFKGVVLGLSGGIDSALTLAIAVDALGAERVEVIMMPYHYTSQMSKDDAAEQAKKQGVRYHSIAIEGVMSAASNALAPMFEGLAKDTTEENLQARSRGLLLMAVSNKKGYLVLTTGNKSEMSVGYATLYGDMVGGFAPIKDVSKMNVYALSKYRNSLSEVIPHNVLTREPSAELAPDQLDKDSLPPYEILDEILACYIEKDMSADAIIDKGFEGTVVKRVCRLVDLSEYKRQQSAIGPRVTNRGLGRDRRYPITNGWHIGS